MFVEKVAVHQLTRITSSSGEEFCGLCCKDKLLVDEEGWGSTPDKNQTIFHEIPICPSCFEVIKQGDHKEVHRIASEAYKQFLEEDADNFYMEFVGSIARAEVVLIHEGWDNSTK